MEALRIRTYIQSDTLQIPDLKQMVGQEAEIIVLVETVSPEWGKKPRTPGSAKGMITLADDFEAPLAPEIVEAFYT